MLKKNANARTFLRQTVLVCLLMTLGLVPVQAAPIEFDIVAAVDGHIHQTNPGTGQIRTVYDANATVYMVNSGGNNLSRGYFEFDISGLPGGIIIQSASLVLKASGTVSSLSGGADLYLHSYDGDGSITEADWFASKTFVGSANYAQWTPANTILETPFSDLSTLAAAIAGGTQYFGIEVGVNFASTVNVYSLESTHAARLFPTLRLNYELAAVPEPGSIALLGVGVFLLALYGYRRRSKA